MRAGQLRHRLTIQSVTDGKDAAGAPTETAATLDTVWASIQPLNGNEVYRGEHFEGEVTHLVRMRYRSGITPKMRLVYGSRTFNVQQVLNVDERGRELELGVTEVV